MGIEKIKEEILQKASAAEKEILAEAEAKVKQARDKAIEQVKQLEKEAAQKFEAEKKSLENREAALANMESQKLMFEAKKSLMDSVYSKAFDKIMSMPAKNREETIKKLIGMAEKEIDISVIFANPKDKKYCGNSVDVRESDISGGIICETKEGNIRVNLTFGNLFADLREKTSKEVSKILFG